MRKTALSAVLIAALAGAPAANAQLATIDVTNAANTLGTLNQLKDQALQLKAQYDKMQEQLGVARDAYEAVSHGPDAALNMIGAKLNVPELREALGTYEDLSAVLKGDNVAGGLGALANDYLERNRVYTPTGTDLGSASSASDLSASAKSIATDQAIANQMWTSSTKHVAALQEIEGQLATAKDAKAVADIQARLTAENAYLQAQQIQMQSVQMMQEAERRNKDQKREELARQHLDGALAAVRQHNGHQ